MIIGRVIGVFFLVLVGIFVNKIGWLPLESTKPLSKLVVNVAAPCVIVSSMSNQELGGSGMQLFLMLAIVAAIQYIYAIAFSIPAARILSPGKEHRGLYRNFLVLSNNAFLGIPITLVIYGVPGMFYMVILNCFLSIVMFTVGVYNVESSLPGNLDGEGSKWHIARFAKSMINAPFIGVIIGMTIMLFQIDVPIIITEVLDTLGAMMAPLAMIIIGVQLSQSNPKELFLNKRLIIMSVLKLLILPGIWFVATLPFYMNGTFNPMMTGALVLNLMFPSATICSIFAEEYGADAKFAAEGVFLSTLLSMITLPIASVLLHML